MGQQRPLLPHEFLSLPPPRRARRRRGETPRGGARPAATGETRARCCAPRSRRGSTRSCCTRCCRNVAPPSATARRHGGRSARSRTRCSACCSETRSCRAAVQLALEPLGRPAGVPAARVRKPGVAKGHHDRPHVRFTLLTAVDDTAAQRVQRLLRATPHLEALFPLPPAAVEARGLHMARRKRLDVGGGLRRIRRP